MTDKELVQALRMHAAGQCGKNCPGWKLSGGCSTRIIEKAADRIEQLSKEGSEDECSF